MGRILIGISSWADQSLIGSGRFYPAEVKTAVERLHYYGANFPITELDSSFYAFPMRRNLDVWLENTPAGFIFDVKAFRLFSQHPTPPNSIPRRIREKFGDLIAQGANLYINHLPQEVVQEVWQAFAEAVRPVADAGKLGVIFVQFPPWFHYRSENLDYLATCRKNLPGYRLAVEFRTGSWLNDENREKTLAFMREQGLALVCVDEPQGLKSSVPPVAEVTVPPGIIRFHGRNRENWERGEGDAQDRFRYFYNDDELREWLPRIRYMADKTEEVHVIFKNKYEDFPIQNARQMVRMLG